MQVNLNTNCNCPKPQFGMALRFQAGSVADYYKTASNFTIKELKELALISKKMDACADDVFVKEGNNGKFVAEVGQKVFKQGRFNSPLKIVKKGAKEAESLRKREIDLKIDKKEDFSQFIKEGNVVETSPSDSEMVFN